MRTEGYLISVRALSQKREFYYELLLRTPSSYATIYDRPECGFRFWLSTTNPKIVEQIRQTGATVASAEKFTIDGKKHLYEISVTNPKLDRVAVRNIAHRRAKLYGYDRTSETDYFNQRDIRLFDYVIAETHDTRGKQVVEKICAEKLHDDFSPRTCAFDIEVYNKGSFPDPKQAQQPVIMISLADASEARVFTTKQSSHDFVVQCHDEAAMLHAFVEAVQSNGYDFILTYNGDSFDFPYMRKRLEGFDEKLSMSSTGVPVTWRRGGMGMVSRIAGMHNVDLYQLLKRYYNFPSHCLGDCLAVVLGEHKGMSGADVWKHWDSDNIDDLALYSRNDAAGLIALSEKLGITDALVHLSRRFGIRPEDMARKKPDEICNFLAERKSIATGGVAYNKPWITGNNYDRTRKEVVALKPGRGTARLYPAHKKHAEIITSMKAEMQREHREPVELVAEELLHEQELARNNPTAYRFLRELGFYVPALIVSRRYPWHHQQLAQGYKRAYRRWARHATDRSSLVHAGWRDIITDAMHDGVIEPELEGQFSISGEHVYSFMHNGFLYTHGYTATARRAPSFVNTAVDAILRELHTHGPERAQLVLKNYIGLLSDIEKEQLVYHDRLTKPAGEYKQQRPVVQIAQRTGGQPFQDIAFVAFRGGFGLPDETRSIDTINYRNEILRRVAPAFAATRVDEHKLGASLYQERLDL